MDNPIADTEEAGEGETSSAEEAAEPTDEELLEEGRSRYKLCAEAWSHNQTAWLEDAKFREPGKGNQWPADIRAQREALGLPCLEVDKLNQYVRQVVNDSRQNRPGIKVRPEGDGADADVALGLNDLIRGICARSNADEAFDTAIDHASGNGYGFFRVITEYAHPGTFNQEMKVRRITNPRAVMLDPYIEAADGSDARYGFVEVDIPKDDFKRQYPKAKFTNWDGDASKYGDGWLSNDCVRVCEYFYKVETPKLVHLLETGVTITDEDYQAILGEMDPQAPKPKIMDSRELPTCEVKWCRMTGAEILERKPWLGQYIPLVMVIGNESNIDGKVTYSGLIRPAKDAMRLYNYSRSAFAQRVALTTKAPWMAAAEQIADFPEWETANTGTHQVLRYKHLAEDGTVIPPPQRINPSEVPAGYAQDMSIAEHDIQGTMGMYNSSLGEKSNEKSGRAITARQREGDTSTFHYPDNLNRSIRYLGRIMVDLAPKVYDSRRTVYLLGEDGSHNYAQVDPEQDEAMRTQAGKKIYNFGIGVYGVDVSAGPSYTTKRQEAVEAQMQLVQSAPETMQFAGDLIVKNMDWPGADALAERYRMMLPPQIQQALQAKEQGQDPKIAAATAPLKQGLDQAHQALQQQQQALAQQGAELQSLKQAKDIDARKVDIEAYKAETERMTALAPAMTPEAVAAIVQQTVVTIMQQPVPTEPPSPSPLAAAPPLQPPPNGPPLVAAPADPNQPAPAGFSLPNGPSVQ